MINIQGTQYTVIFRFFFLIASTLFIIGLLFDAVINHQHIDQTEQQQKSLIDGQFSLIEYQLNRIPLDQYDDKVMQMSQQLAMSILLLDAEDINNSHPGIVLKSHREIHTFYNAEGDVYFFKSMKGSSKLLVLGPFSLQEISENQWQQWMPILFYLCIFIVVGLWMRPMIKDLDALNRTAMKLKDDYSTPVDVLRHIKTLPEITRTIITMAEHLQRLISTQKELSNALSHELRTPLSRIKFALALLKNNTISEHAYIDQIEQDVHEMESIADSLLTYARLDNPDCAIKKQSILVESWLWQISQKFVASYPDKKFNCGSEIDVDLISFDPYLMAIAVSNLINNATQYSAAVIKIRLYTSGDRARITVEDDGAGIPYEHHENIFKAFYRLDSSRDKRTGGHGLGLSIVKRIVELHGGEVSVQSSMLGGACFTLEWPAG